MLGVSLFAPETVEGADPAELLLFAPIDVTILHEHRDLHIVQRVLLIDEKEGVLATVQPTRRVCHAGDACERTEGQTLLDAFTPNGFLERYIPQLEPLKLQGRRRWHVVLVTARVNNRKGSVRGAPKAPCASCQRGLPSGSALGLDRLWHDLPGSFPVGRDLCWRFPLGDVTKSGIDLLSIVDDLKRQNPKPRGWHDW